MMARMPAAKTWARGGKAMKERFHIYMRICRQNGPTTLNHPMWFRWVLTGK
jgi:hypothetical protein